MGVSVLTLESQLGSHRCKWLHPQRKRRPFGVIWSGAKMCIDRVTFESRGNQSAFLRDVGRVEQFGASLGEGLKDIVRPRNLTGVTTPLMRKRAPDFVDARAAGVRRLRSAKYVKSAAARPTPEGRFWGLLAAPRTVPKCCSRLEHVVDTMWVAWVPCSPP